MGNNLRAFGFISVLGLSLIFSGCAVLVGNVRPVDQKSQLYGVLDLSKSNADWIRLGAAKTDKPTSLEATELPDVAYQSKKTDSIISLDSVCRDGPENSSQDLKSLTGLLLLGISDVTLRQEEPLVLMGHEPALQTTVEGRLGGDTQGKRMALRTVVVKHGGCDYDFVYMARPENFNAHEPDFSQFVASLRLK